MPEYRRLRVPGGTYFFTVALADRRATLLIDHVDALRAAVRAARRALPFQIDAWVVLPDHMHCLWTLPEGDADFAGRWRLLKTRFTRAIPEVGRRSCSRILRQERGVWQRRFWEHTIRDDADYARHMDYIHFNPVKHGLCDHPAAWPYSTFHRCVREGTYPASWSVAAPDVAAGERAVSTRARSGDRHEP